MTGSSPRALLSVLLESLPVDGGSVSVVSRSGLSSTILSSDPVASRLDALQTDLGEGPRWAVRETGAPVIVRDLAECRSRWPIFTAALPGLPVEGLFAFPLVIGFQLVGVVDLYSRTSGGVWTDDVLTAAMQAAAALARPAVRLAARSAAADQPTSGTAELRREVHQATGVLMVGLGLPPDQALSRMEAYAFAADRPLLDVARDVIAGRLDSDALSG